MVPTKLFSIGLVCEAVHTIPAYFIVVLSFGVYSVSWAFVALPSAVDHERIGLLNDRLFIRVVL